MWTITVKTSVNDSEPVKQEFNSYEDMIRFLIMYNCFRNAIIKFIMEGSGNNG